MADLITYRQDLLSICHASEKRGGTPGADYFGGRGGHVVEHPDTSELLLFMVSKSKGSRIYKVNEMWVSNDSGKSEEDRRARTLPLTEFDSPINGFVPLNYSIPWETRHNWEARRFRYIGTGNFLRDVANPVKRRVRVGKYSMKELEAQVKSLSEGPFRDELLAQPPDILGITVMAENVLEREGIKTVGDLTQRTYDQVRGFKSMNRYSAEQVERGLGARGLYLKPVE